MLLQKATFKDVAYLLIDNDGTIYILEENNSLRKLEASGKVSTVFASTGYRKRAYRLFYNRRHNAYGPR